MNADLEKRLAEIEARAQFVKHTPLSKSASENLASSDIPFLVAELRKAMENHNSLRQEFESHCLRTNRILSENTNLKVQCQAMREALEDVSSFYPMGTNPFCDEAISKARKLL